MKKNNSIFFGFKKTKLHYLILNLLILPTIFISQFAEARTERKEFKAEIGKKPSDNSLLIKNDGGTYTFSGKGGGQNNQNSILPNLPTNNVSTGLKSGESKSISRDEFNQMFNEQGEGVLYYQGGNTKINKKNQQIQNVEAIPLPQPELIKNNNINPVYKSKVDFTTLSEEIPIPKDFNLLNTFVDTPTIAPTQLPESEMRNSIISDKELRQAVYSLMKRKNGVSLNKNQLSEALNLENETLDLSVNNNNKLNEQIKNKFTSKENELWYKYLLRESQIMMLSGLPMKIIVIPNKEDVMYSFMINSLLKGREVEIENVVKNVGLYSLLGFPKVGKVTLPVCYVVMSDDFNELKDKHFNILTKTQSKEAISSLYLGKNIAHCLDGLEREKKLPRNNTWYAKDVEKERIGIMPSLYDKYYPRGLTYKHVIETAYSLFNHNEQKQFQYNLFDSFGLLWAYNRGYKDIVKSYEQIISTYPKYSIYNTSEAINQVKKEIEQLKFSSKTTLSNIWKISRDIQYKVNISKDLSKQQDLFLTKQENELKQNKSSKIEGNYTKKTFKVNELGNKFNVSSKGELSLATLKPVQSTLNQNDLTKTKDFSSMKNLNTTKSLEKTKSKENIEDNMSLLKKDVSKNIKKPTKTILIENQNKEVKTSQGALVINKDTTSTNNIATNNKTNLNIKKEAKINDKLNEKKTVLIQPNKKVNNKQIKPDKSFVIESKFK